MTDDLLDVTFGLRGLFAWEQVRGVDGERQFRMDARFVSTVLMMLVQTEFAS